MPGGRPKISWSDKEWKQFEALCRIQCPQTEICEVMDVTDKTLVRLVREHYKKGFSEVYKKKRAGGKASLRRTQFEWAQKSPAMAIYLGKVLLGQREEANDVPADRPTIIINLPEEAPRNGGDKD